MGNITYLIFLHDAPEQAFRLVERLSAPGTDFFIHIDKKARNFDRIVWNRNVYLSSRRFSINWGDVSMIEALSFCCKELLQVCTGKTIVFLSGYDYPVKSNAYIHSYLEKYRNINFIAASSIPGKECKWLEQGRRRIACYALHLKPKSIATIEPRRFDLGNLKQLFKVLKDKPEKLFKALSILLFSPARLHPEYLKPYGGEFWWVLPSESLRRLVDFIEEHPDFIYYHKNTSIPDELFFPTLVYNLFPFSETINSCLRYVNWTIGKSPENIKIGDQVLIDHIIKEKDTLFARKISDLKVCEYIDTQVNH